MRSISLLTPCIWFLISFDVGVTAYEKGENDEKKWRIADKKDEVKPPRPSFPLFALPSISQLLRPTFNFPQIPYLQGLSNVNRVRLPPNIRPTKTEYLEVTRRQTVHPICYTAYEAKSPCLTRDQDYRHETDFDSSHETHENFDFDEVRKYMQSTPTAPLLLTEKPELVYDNLESDRSPKYLEFNAKGGSLRKADETTPITATRVQGAEFVFPTKQVSANVEPTKYFTKTVLITKLEKYTDRRVTATLLAMNCLPVDRAIPICQAYPNPIRESPDGIYENAFRRQDADHNVSSPNSSDENKSENEELANTEIPSSNNFTGEESKNDDGGSVREDE